jgi:hypothetical protein
MPTMSTVVLLYFLGYLPAAPLPLEIAPPVPHLQCETFTESEYLASEEDILHQIKERGRCIDPTVSYAPSLEGPSWWMNPAPTEPAGASFFDFTASR